jgi:hypothetical protein
MTNFESPLRFFLQLAVIVGACRLVGPPRGVRHALPRPDAGRRRNDRGGAPRAVASRLAGAGVAVVPRSEFAPREGVGSVAVSAAHPVRPCSESQEGAARLAGRSATDEDSMTLTPGTRLGPYEIQAAIGAGGRCRS